MSETQTIFRFPSIVTTARVLGLISVGQADQAVKILARAYRVKPPSIYVDPDAIYKSYKDTFITTDAIYSHGTKTIYCKTPILYQSESTVLHEFFHHLCHEFNVKHEETIVDEWARLFRWNIGDFTFLTYFYIYPKYFEDYVIRLSALACVDSISNSQMKELFGISFHSSLLWAYQPKLRKWSRTPKALSALRLAHKLDANAHGLQKMVFDKLEKSFAPEIIKAAT